MAVLILKRFGLWEAREKNWAPVMYCQGHQLRKPARRRTGQVQVSGNYQQLDVRWGKMSFALKA